MQRPIALTVSSILRGSATPTEWRLDPLSYVARHGSSPRDDTLGFPDSSWEAETPEFVAANNEGRQPIGDCTKQSPPGR